MKNMKKIVLFSFIVLFAFVCTFGLTSKTEAAGDSCVSAGSGDWNKPTTWTCATGPIPSSIASVTIGSGHIVTIVDASSASALDVKEGATLNISGSNSLNVANNIQILSPVSAGISKFDIGSGSVTIGKSMIMSGTAADKIAEVGISTGTLDVGDSIGFSTLVASSTKLTSTDVSSIYVGGNFMSPGVGTGTFDGTGSTLFLDGALAQTLGASTGYNNVYVANTSGSGVTLSVGTTKINGTIQIYSATTSTYLDTRDADLTVTGATSIGENGALSISSTTGSKIFDGDVDILTGGIWNETVAEDVTFNGNFINDGTTIFSTGNHTFAGLLKTIDGENKLTNVIVDGTLSNLGVLTVKGDLTGTGILTNSTDATLKITGTISADIVATATGNIVQYNKAGDQSVKSDEDYYNLYLLGSGTKTISAGIDVAGDFYIAPGVIADLTGDSTANRLAIGDPVPLEPGVYGPVGSTNPLVDHESASLTGTGSITVPDITPPTLAITLADSALTYGETTTVTFTFSEEVTGFSNTDITVENGTLTNVATTDNIVFTATFTPTASVNDATNVITVGVVWTDLAFNSPVAPTVSANYTINTVRARSTSSSGSYAPGYTPIYIATPTTTPVITTPTFIFTKVLKYLVTNTDVKELQKFLNTHGYQIAATGAGSPGHETNFFGSLTKKAVIKFQLANKLVGDGIIGPKTNAVLNSMK